MNKDLSYNINKKQSEESDKSSSLVQGEIKTDDVEVDNDAEIKILNNHLRSIGETKYDCLGKCHKNNNLYYHPLFPYKISSVIPHHVSYNKNDGSCPVYPRHIQKDGNDKYILFEACNIADNDTKIYLDENDGFLNYPQFTSLTLLKHLYKLDTFSAVIIWTLENAPTEEYSFHTIKRIHNAAWKSYGYNLENLTENVISFYYDLSHENWLPDYIKKIKNEYSFDIIGSTDFNSDSGIDKLITSLYFTEEDFTDVVHKFIEEKKNIWKKINSHYGALKKYVYTMLIMRLMENSK